jgi:hypothetical protein
MAVIAAVMNNQRITVGFFNTNVLISNVICFGSSQKACAQRLACGRRAIKNLRLLPRDKDK